MTIGNLSTPPFNITVACALLSITTIDVSNRFRTKSICLGGALYFLWKAVGNIKIGIGRKLGHVLVDDDDEGEEVHHRESQGPLRTPQKTPAGVVRYKRRLGLLERWYVAHSRSGCHTGFLSCLELEGHVAPSVDQVKDILRLVAKSYPWLRARVRRSGIHQKGSRLVVDSRERLENPWMESTEPLWGDDLYVEIRHDGVGGENFDDDGAPPAVVKEVWLDGENEDGSSLTKLLQTEGATEWHDEDPNEPLWRVTLVRYEGERRENTFALVWSFHHLIADGLSACHVIREFLRHAQLRSFHQGNAAESADAMMVDPPNNEDCNEWHDGLSPPMEDILDANPTLGHIIIPVLLDRFPSLMPWFKPPFWTGSTVHREEASNTTTADAARSSHMERLNLVQNMDDFEAKIAMKGITSNSFLVVCLMKAIQIVVGDQEARKLFFKVTVAASERGRRAANITPRDLGVYLSGPQVWMKPGIGNLTVWKMSLLFRKKLMQSLRTSCQDMGLVKFITEDWIQFATKQRMMEPNGIQESLEMSNLGRIDDLPLEILVGVGKSNNNWKVKNLWFAQGRKGFGAAITVCIVGTNFGGINAVLSAFPQAVTPSKLHKIATEWKSQVEVALKTL